MRTYLRGLRVTSSTCPMISILIPSWFSQFMLFHIEHDVSILCVFTTYLSTLITTCRIESPLDDLKQRNSSKAECRHNMTENSQTATVLYSFVYHVSLPAQILWCTCSQEERSYTDALLAGERRDKLLFLDLSTKQRFQVRFDSYSSC
jgi:hypothetical protein